RPGPRFGHFVSASTGEFEFHVRQISSVEKAGALERVDRGKFVRLRERLSEADAFWREMLNQRAETRGSLGHAVVRRFARFGRREETHRGFAGTFDGETNLSYA